MTSEEPPITTLHCIACERQEDVTTSQFRCQSCGDLLEVRHAFEQHPACRDADSLRQRFAGRLQQLGPPYVSGVWRYHELILPDLPAEAIVSLPEGNTPLYRRPALERFLGLAEAYVKHLFAAPLAACPEDIFSIFEENGARPRAVVREEVRKKLSYLCPGIAACSSSETDCHRACPQDAISHSW